ncbi:vigilin [Nephila pilipes]|uniref:Vigilin n=1 Tax=Nephila pilipes TaxID=299642 RepID=A0A8X6IQW3_NEPPI|nr:vigilin [Nephila pilipes]
MKLTNSCVEVPIYKQNHKFIIGKGAETDVIAIRGPKEDVTKTKKRLLDISNEKQLIGHTAEIVSNPEQDKFLIGKNGTSIKKVIDKTGIRMVFPNENDNDKNTITTIGIKEEVETAKNEINSPITQLIDTAETTIEIDPKLHHYFVRSAEVLKPISNDYSGVPLVFLKLALIVSR